MMSLFQLSDNVTGHGILIRETPDHVLDLVFNFKYLIGCIKSLLERSNTIHVLCHRFMLLHGKQVFFVSSGSMVFSTDTWHFLQLDL